MSNTFNFVKRNRYQQGPLDMLEMLECSTYYIHRRSEVWLPIQQVQHVQHRASPGCDSSLLDIFPMSNIFCMKNVIRVFYIFHRSRTVLGIAVFCPEKTTEDFTVPVKDLLTYSLCVPVHNHYVIRVLYSLRLFETPVKIRLLV